MYKDSTAGHLDKNGHTVEPTSSQLFTYLCTGFKFVVYAVGPCLDSGVGNLDT